MIQDLSGSWCIKRSGESMTRVDSQVPLMHHDPDRSWITDSDPDHPKGMQPKLKLALLAFFPSAILFTKNNGGHQLPWAL